MCPLKGFSFSFLPYVGCFLSYNLILAPKWNTYFAEYLPGLQWEVTITHRQKQELALKWSGPESLLLWSICTRL